MDITRAKDALRVHPWRGRFVFYDGFFQTWWYISEVDLQVLGRVLAITEPHWRERAKDIFRQKGEFQAVPLNEQVELERQAVM